MTKMSFDKEFFYPTLIFFIITVLVYLWQPIAAIFFAILTAGAALFFRDPHRDIPEDQDIIVSPADGTILGVTEVEEKDYFKTRVKKVSIFLSVLDVHINRSPIKGTVAKVRYVPGKFLAAYKQEAAVCNEQNMVFIEGEKFPVLVVQIAGFIARRIVCRVQEGVELERGQRFGLIRFGSCTELYVPIGTEIEVKKGDKVRGGETIIGRWKGE
ncbi:MAG: phosphatidylserine decarboxylase family protein [Bacillota bacterium]